MTPFVRRTSLCVTIALGAIASSSARAQGPSPVLDAVEVRRLVASAAIADQATLAAHFSALADRHAAGARRHDAMGNAAVDDPRRPSAGLKVHCARLARLERDAEATLRALAAHHATLAGGALSTAPAKSAKYQAGADAREPTEADLARLASRAATPADHRALQEYFQAFARRNAEDADGHAAMATLYRTTSRLAPVASHCDRLVDQLRAIAAEAGQAAQMHGALAAK